MKAAEEAAARARGARRSRQQRVEFNPDGVEEEVASLEEEVTAAEPEEDDVAEGGKREGAARMRIAMERMKGANSNLFNMSEISVRDEEEVTEEERVEEDSVWSDAERKQRVAVDHGQWLEAAAAGSGLWVFTSTAAECVENRTRICPLVDADQHVLRYMHGLVNTDPEGLYTPQGMGSALKDNRLWNMRNDLNTRSRECRKRPRPEWCGGVAGQDGSLSRSLDTLEHQWRRSAAALQQQKLAHLASVKKAHGEGGAAGPEEKQLADAREALGALGKEALTLEAEVAAQEVRVALKKKGKEEALNHMRRDSGKKMLAAEWAESETFDRWQVVAQQAQVHAERQKERHQREHQPGGQHPGGRHPPDLTTQQLLGSLTWSHGGAAEEEPEGEVPDSLALDAHKEMHKELREELLEEEGEGEVRNAAEVERREMEVEVRNRERDEQWGEKEMREREREREQKEKEWAKRQAERVERAKKEDLRQLREEARREKEKEAKRKMEEQHQNQLVTKVVTQGMDNVLNPRNRNELREAKAIMGKVAQALWTKRSAEVDTEAHLGNNGAIKQDKAAEMTTRLRPEEMAALGLDEDDDTEGEDEGA